MARQPREGSNEPRTASNEEILAASREYVRLKRENDEAVGRLRSALKRMKGEGIPTDAIRRTHAESRKDPETVTAEMRQLIRVLGLRRVVSIEDLLDETDVANFKISDTARVADDIADAESAGYRSGRMGVPVEECPHPAGSELHVAWRKWHANGMASAGREMGQNAKQADASRKRPGRKPKGNGGGRSLTLVGGGRRRGRPPKGADATA